MFVRLAPPEGDDAAGGDGDGTSERTIAFDDLRLIEWADADGGAGREHDHLEIDGTATVTLAAGTTPTGGSVRWRSLEGESLE